MSAEQEAKRLVIHNYPREDGWYGHSVSINDATQQVIDLVGDLL